MSQSWNLPLNPNVSRYSALVDILPGCLESLRTQHSGATAPASPVPHMIWTDTTAGLIKRRNAANDAWITVGSAVQRWDSLLAEEPFANVSATFPLAPFVAAQDCTIVEVVLGANTATAGSTTSHEYQFALVNVTQSNASFFSTLQRTSSAEVAANTAYVMACDQNQNVVKNDILAFTLTKVGTGPPGTDWTAAKVRLQVRGWSR